MKKIHRVAACLLAAALLCPLLLPFKADAAEVKYGVSTSKNSSGNLYVHKFDGTSYQFITSVEDNSTASSVSIYVSSDDYTLSASTDAITTATKSNVGNLIKYTVTSTGTHSVKIVAPAISGSSDRPYNYFNFTVSGGTTVTTKPSQTVTTSKQNAAIKVILNETAVSSVLYKEKFSNNDAWTFSTNIKNGGTTTGSVVFTFPSALKFSITKDGSPISYSSGASITNVGSYTAKVYASETQNGTTAEYYAVFSFKIVSAEQTTRAPVITTTRRTTARPTTAATTSRVTAAPTTRTTARTTARVTTTRSIVITKPYVTNPSTTSSGPSSVKTTLEERANSNGTYTETLNADSSWSFTSTVKNGGTSTSAVSFTVPATMKMALMRGNTETAYTSGTKISVSGTYTMKVSAVKGFSEYYALFTFKIELPETEKNIQTSLTETSTGDGRYKHIFKADSSFSFVSNVKNGATVTKSVQITRPSNLTFEILRNGVPVSGSSFSAAGTYSIKITAKKGLTTYYAMFSFTIKDTSVPTTTTKATVKPVYTLRETTLFETQNQDGTFAEALNGNDAWKFNSNISNGSISNVPVKFIVPTTVAFAVSRDGQSIAYASGGVLNVIGDYTVKVTGRSGNIEYYAYFTFRIEQRDAASEYELLQTTLIENYGEDGRYSEKLNNNDNWTFYSNVANNGVSAVPVKFSIPETISFVISRDGQDVPYTSGAQLSDPGSYSVKVSVVNGTTEYYALFYFDIMSQEQQANSDEKKEIIKTVNYNMTVKADEEFLVNDAETYIIKDGGSITVESGAVLRIKQGGTVQINQNGNIHIKAGGSYFVDDGATLQIDGGSMKIDSRNQATERITENTLILAEQRVVPAGKIMIVESGATLTVADGSSLKIENGGALLIKSGASVIINQGGSFNKEPDSVLSVENGGLLYFDDMENAGSESDRFEKISGTLTVKSGQSYDVEYSSVLQNGASITVEKGGQLNIRGNSKLFMEKGSILKIAKGAKLCMEDASELKVYKGAVLSVENSRRDMSMGNGARLILGRDIQDERGAETDIAELMDVKSGSELKINKNDRFTVKSGGTVSINAGARLEIADGSAFSVEQGGSIADANFIVDENGTATGTASAGNAWYTYFSRPTESESGGKLVVAGGGLVNLTNSGKIHIETGAYMYNNGTVNMQTTGDINGIANVVGTGNVWYGGGNAYDISSSVGLNLFENITGDSENITDEEMNRLMASLRSKEIPADTMTMKGFVSEYDPAMNMFRITFESGNYFYSSVTDGMMANQNVKFAFDDPESVNAELYLNDTKVDYTAGKAVSEHGFYRMRFPDEANGSVVPEFTFAVINRPVNNVHIISAPEGFVFTGVKIGEQQHNVFSTRYMLSENRYEFTLSGIDYDGLTFKFTVERDVTPPRFNLFGMEGGKSVLPEITVVRNSDDIYAVELYDRSGKQVESFDGEVIKNAGKYKIYVKDAAGNVSFEQFELKYEMNGATIATIAAVVFFIAVAVGAALYSRRNVRVR